LSGLLAMLFDPAKLSEGAPFATGMLSLVYWVATFPPQLRFDQVRLAGKPERETRPKRLAEGILGHQTS